MLTFLLGSVASCVGISAFGYAAHRVLHEGWTWFLHDGHMVHHIQLYPPHDFFSETYRSAGKDNTAKTFFIAGLPLLGAPLLASLFGVVSLTTGFILIAEMLAVGYLHDYLHDSFHIKDHWLNRYAPFRKLVRLHQVHHEHMQKNFGIFTFVWDKLFGSFQDR
jgi:sterol desaturase/sphingolipid hydroxylase (fatty acid hydroxylase superfamily)